MKNRKIIAVDFDGTIVKDEWPRIGEIKIDVMRRLEQEIKENDAYIIIWTCRAGKQLDEMQKWLDKYYLPYDRINANAPWILDEWKRDNRKIFAHEYWDDRAVKI
ncbi:hypothetical protein [Halocella sp. SP3-1]|uniref:hypothetical protein n=1 Tax=Halocella sp. SP3-1 TaxID=2382161 RepID=UPI000F75BF28|nr:hypothetical protein [Halocella sp. SP3-1]AZO96156.1 hypothetical protein D7D81_17020 [Halocella sp. SP3-1]